MLEFTSQYKNFCNSKSAALEYSSAADFLDAALLAENSINLKLRKECRVSIPKC